MAVGPAMVSGLGLVMVVDFDQAAVLVMAEGLVLLVGLVVATALCLAVGSSTVAGFVLAIVVDLGQGVVLVMVERLDQVVDLAVVVGLYEV